MRIALGFLLAAGVVAGLVFAVLSEARVRCEVCVEYAGRRACEASRAGDRDHALMQARNTACARVSGGVTDGMRCNNLPPLSIECTE